MFRTLTHFSVQLVNRYLPSPFSFAVLLTLCAFLLGMTLTHQSPVAMAVHWGDGLWSLHGFAMQMALILITGYALANAPIVQNFLDFLASKITRPTTAIFVVTFVAMIGCLLNWGFGLVIGAIFAKSLAKKVPNVDYPLLVAAAYSGFLVWHGGLSGSIPLTLSSGGETLATLSGGTLMQAVPLSQTIFSTYNLVIVVLIVLIVPLMNAFMHPKKPTTIDPKLIAPTKSTLPTPTTPAERLDDSRIIMAILGVVALLYYVGKFTQGVEIGLNIVIGLFLFAGVVLHGSLERYYRAVGNGIGGITGIVLLFPFYGGIMGLVTGKNADGTSLGTVFTEFFLQFATQDTFALLAFLSAGLVNFFVPSGGGQFAVQGVIMLPAGAALGVDLSVSAMAIAWGDSWTNMIQPFWALPLLGIAGLDARAIMGYCLMIFFISGAIMAGGLYFLT
ncbi:short-chain fatty acid transporter [Moraxella caviae]|uniref:Short-chain fatty acid transporter n=1 Tax=Moraxella caviae TaxID=34060 RepID=A0A1T0A1E0_9GAMM|nr:TIGR00366 family protein [Moraxella caviae]OOR89572.1 short-chain fatty acid transporter [Moraxella caviae]STZ10253.1 Short-chain fatty acids transporter [Moraxella caviae]VEW13244.1 Short-chain fatty acids transporter [Moraxella caviae]